MQPASQYKVGNCYCVHTIHHAKTSKVANSRIIQNFLLLPSACLKIKFFKLVCDRTEGHIPKIMEIPIQLVQIVASVHSKADLRHFQHWKLLVGNHHKITKNFYSANKHQTSISMFQQCQCVQVASILRTKNWIADLKTEAFHGLVYIVCKS